MNELNGMALICFSHLRWNFVYQRPQHLMSRVAIETRVFFFEEPYYGDTVHFEIVNPIKNLWVVIPHLVNGISEGEAAIHQKEFIAGLMTTMNIKEYILWYYTPMAMPISEHLRPEVIVYDCMDELSNFKFAPQALKYWERKLLKKADIVFTGGYSLFKAKKNQHHNIYPFPSSVDLKHFIQSRQGLEEPFDQANIPHPRFGFYGVIDERMDLDLITGIALQREGWHIILIGPVLKIKQDELPRYPNIHYLGMKSYAELPQYLAGWDVAIMPFALNESTRLISPTKTPEYLAGGKQVISTPIRDVIRDYCTVVHFASTVEDFIRVAENDIAYDFSWLGNVDELLKQNSWDKTWKDMRDIMHRSLYIKTNKFLQINSKAHV